MLAVKHPASRETIKPMTTLGITRGLGGKGTSGSGTHAVVMLFVDLNIFTKFCSNVFVVINLHTGDQFSGVD